MVYSPNRKPLRELTEGQLREMATQLAKTVDYNFNDVIGELTYREQRRISKWVAVFIAGTLAAHIVGIVLKVVL